MRLVNPARSVTFGGSDGVLALTINAAEEYGTHPRAGNDPWVHLLVEQPLVAAPKLGDLTALRLHLEARRLHARLTSDAGYDPRIHAAQFQIFITVQNLNKESPGYGNYLWFGVPIFDNRKRVVSTYSAPDFGGTGKFIHTPGSEHFTRGSTHDEGWVAFDAELLPLINEGMVAARNKGFLKGLDEAQLFRVTAFNMGWEVPGTFDVGMQVRKLSLISELR